MFYQVAILCFSATAVLAAPADVPLEKQQPTVIPIVSQSDELEPNGTYKFSYETANGIKREETSYIKIVPKPEGRSGASNEGGESAESDEIQVQQGSYSYTAPDGTVITVRYIADENGFQVFGDHLPRVPVAAPLQLTVRSGEKSGRALKSAGDVDAASVPADTAEPEPAAKSAQSEPQAQEPSSVPASAGAAEVESKSTEVAAEPSSTPIAAESTTLGSAQGNSASDASQSTTVAAEQATMNVEVTTAAADQPAPTAAEDQSTPAAAPENAAPVASDEQSTSAQANDNGSDQPATVPITEQSVPEEPASTTVSA